MDFNNNTQPNPTSCTATEHIFTNFLSHQCNLQHPASEYESVYMIPFCKLQEGIISEILTDGDFEEEDDLDNLELGHVSGQLVSSCPNFLDDSQILALKQICEVRHVHSVLLGIGFPVYSFQNVMLELALINTPLNQRSFYLHSALNVWCRMMESYLNFGPLVIDQTEFEYEIGYLRERINDPLFSFAFSFLFYGTVIMEWIITGKVVKGVKGGKDDEEEEVDLNPPEPARVSRKTPPELSDDDEKPPVASKKKEKPQRKAKEAGRKERKTPASKKSFPCKSCGKTEHKTYDCPKKCCFICKEEGHFADKCPKKPEKATRKGRGEVRRGAKKANLVQNNLIQSLQEAQGEADALREQAAEREEQLVEEALQREEENIPATPAVPRFDRKPVGITYRTDSITVIEASEVVFKNTALGNYVSTVSSFFASCAQKIAVFVGTKTGLSRAVRKEYETLYTLIRYMNLIKEQKRQAEVKKRNWRVLNILGWLCLLRKAKVNYTTRRIGGLIHKVDLESIESPHEDVRLDYLAVGDLKHKNPEYCNYSITAEELKHPYFSTILASLCGFPVEIKFGTKTGKSVQKSLVSKVAFKNLASFRLSPFTTEESARNSVLMSLTKMPSVNLSRHFIEDVNDADGMSDEASTRTFEAIMAFRKHLVEQQIFRSFSKEFVKDDVFRRRPGIFTPDQEFIEKSLN